MSVAVELSRAAVGRLRYLVQLDRLKYAELAAVTGTHPATVSGFLNHRQPNWAINTFVRLASALRHDVGIVLIPRGEPYRWCGEQDCSGGHWLREMHQERCHGAPVR